MHPAGTTVYGGGGYSGEALLYPNGMVVDQNGMQVGMYQNGQFTPVQNGQFVAKQAPSNALQQMQQPAQVTLIQSYSPWEIAGIVVIVLLVIIVIIAFAI
jgi:hypothetical protein